MEESEEGGEERGRRATAAHSVERARRLCPLSGGPAVQQGLAGGPKPLRSRYSAAAHWPSRSPSRPRRCCTSSGVRGPTAGTEYLHTTQPATGARAHAQVARGSIRVRPVRFRLGCCEVCVNVSARRALTGRLRAGVGGAVLRSFWPGAAMWALCVGVGVGVAAVARLPGMKTQNGQFRAPPAGTAPVLETGPDRTPPSASVAPCLVRRRAKHALVKPPRIQG